MYINIYLHYVEGDTIEGDTLILYLTDTSAGNDTVDDDSNDIVLLRLNTVLLHQLLLLLQYCCIITIGVHSRVG